MKTRLEVILVIVAILIGAGATVYGLFFRTSTFPNDQPPTQTPGPTSTPRPTPVCTEIKDAKGVAMCLVPAGKFIMGSDQDYGNETNPGDAGPAHSVSLDAFYIDKYEVTNALYKNCVDAGGCTLPGDVSNYNNSQYANHPVVFVDWNQATAYCTWRGTSTDLGQGRLPGEAEWEKAARGPNGDPYPWGNDAPDKNLANYGQNVGGTTPVGSYARGTSLYGVYDMAGNVWEWVADNYSAYPGNTSAAVDFGTTYRVLRGGSWDYDFGYMRASFRDWGHPDTRTDNFGFRCARSAVAP